MGIFNPIFRNPANFHLLQLKFGGKQAIHYICNRNESTEGNGYRSLLLFRYGKRSITKHRKNGSRPAGRRAVIFLCFITNHPNE